MLLRSDEEPAVCVRRRWVIRALTVVVSFADPLDPADPRSLPLSLTLTFSLLCDEVREWWGVLNGFANDLLCFLGMRICTITTEWVDEEARLTIGSSWFTLIVLSPYRYRHHMYNIKLLKKNSDRFDAI